MVDGRVKEGLTLELNKLNRELLLALMLADLEGDEDDEVDCPNWANLVLRDADRRDLRASTPEVCFLTSSSSMLLSTRASLSSSFPACNL